LVEIARIEDQSFDSKKAASRQETAKEMTTQCVDASPLINKPEYDRADCINQVAERQFRLV
jgi:hypothetical protein